VAGSIASAITTNAKEITTQTANSNAAAVSKNAASNATIQAGQKEATNQLGLKLAAEAAAAGGAP
jgi:predicted membrane-bound mannosyltransferase